MRRALADKVKRMHKVSLSENANRDPLINGNVPIGVGTYIFFFFGGGGGGGLVSVQFFF